jgi:hypothetical protein
MPDKLAALHALARPVGLSFTLKFFARTNVPDLRCARGTGRCRRCGPLIDTLHFNRSGSSLADLETLPP